MRSKTFQIITLGAVILGLLLIAEPFLVSHAQKTNKIQTVEDRDKQIGEARETIKKSVVGSILFDTISLKQPEWVLDKAGYMERDQQNNSYFDVLLKRGDSTVGISISEYESPIGADKPFHVPREYGSGIPFNKYGDKGETTIGERGELTAIFFRQGRFFVAVFNPDQKTAELFAKYASDAIKSMGEK
jgi:hypothetical protein